MRKILISSILAISLAFPAPAMAKSRLVMPMEFYKRLSQCETAGNVNHSTRSYTGAFGIYRRTWQQYSNHTSAKGMSFEDQAKVVDNIAFMGFTKKGQYNWPVGPWGWGTIKRQNCMNLQGYICRSNHKKVQRWKRGC